MVTEEETTPPSSVSSRGNEPGGNESDGQGDVEAPATARPPPRKRRRIIISCTECHRRKQKCDRNLPCTNCVSRNKQDSCRYETGAPTAKAVQRARARDEWPDGNSTNGAGDGSLDPGRGAATGGSSDAMEPGIPAKMTNFGYSATGASTLGFLKKIDGSGHPDESLSTLAMGREPNGEYFGTRGRYKSLIRQLPPKRYIEKLVDVYFKDFNWNYNVVDQWVFEKQMEEWYNSSFNLLNTEGPQALPPDLRAFPALVFQMIATALLNLPPGPDPMFDTLKYAGSMTFEDLALDYSESGVAVLSLLGKRQVSHTAVIADWVRAAFLKYSGLVTEAWHAIGTAIRDAQECGLHRDSLDPKPKSDKVEDILENQWEIQRRRKTWMVLMSWDVHTAVVLGRPASIDFSVPYTFPVDAPTPTDPSKTPVTVRSEDDPPSPMTRTLWQCKTSIVLKDIIELEKDGPCPKEFSKVDRVHQSLMDLEAQTPAFFRLENPDTRYDGLPECHWIPMVRARMPLLKSFNYIALHRPYIFTRPYSRKEALKASFVMLEAQREHFATLSPKHYKTFSLFFGTFDAIVLMASIFILFPRENTEHVSTALQHFQWAVERFETMSERNRLAATARGVLQAIYVRLKKALGITFVNARSPCPTAAKEISVSSAGVPSTASPPFTNGGSGSTSGSGIFTHGDSSTSANSNGLFSSLSGPSVTTPIDPALGSGSGSGSGSGNDWTSILPEGFDWSSIQPVYAMADVAYNDLMGISSGCGGGGGGGGETTSTSVPNWAGGAALLNDAPSPSSTPSGPGGGGGGGGEEEQPWLFGGDFGNDSVWNLLNQYPAPF